MLRIRFNFYLDYSFIGGGATNVISLIYKLVFLVLTVKYRWWKVAFIFGTFIYIRTSCKEPPTKKPYLLALLDEQMALDVSIRQVCSLSLLLNPSL